MNNQVVERFCDAAPHWMCEGYTYDLRYIAIEDQGEFQILDASIHLNPLPPIDNFSFEIQTSGFLIGQIQKSDQTQDALKRIVNQALQGEISVGERKLVLKKEQAYDHYSESNDQTRSSLLQIRLTGPYVPALQAVDLVSLDNKLRAADPPFDGLDDVYVWLGLDRRSNPSISIRIAPPVDLDFKRTSLNNDVLDVAIQSHRNYAISNVGLAVRAVPGRGIASRKQISREIQWSASKSQADLRVGQATLRLEGADNALLILQNGGTIVRRHWLSDPVKARNSRLVVTQHFDKDLQKIKSAVFEEVDGTKFEMGISALLFLLGFSSFVQLENDSPDLIVSTPSGRLIIVECTTKLNDFHTKLGKLIHRRGSLATALNASEHQANVIAVLLCRLPKDQIKADHDELKRHQILLMTGDELKEAFDRTRYPINPDKMVDDLLLSISRSTLEMIKDG